MNGLLILLLILNIADIYITLLFLKAGIPEANPFMQFWMDIFGKTAGLLLPKLLVMFLLWSMSLQGLLPQEVIAVFCLGYAGLLIWNYIQLRKSK